MEPAPGVRDAHPGADRAADHDLDRAVEVAASLDADLVRAVREEVVAYGVRRATATSIAARAGVHRVTLYRRGGGIRRLILDALVAVFAGLAAEVRADVGAEAGHATTRELVAHLFARGVMRLREEALVGALLDHDPDLLLTYLVDRVGASQQIVLDTVTPLIAEGIADGTIRGGDPGPMARVLLQACTPFIVGRRILDDLPPDLVGEEVRRLVDGYLRPEE